jgi:hypothetical protein
VGDPRSQGKPFDISKRLVWEAYLRVIPEGAWCVKSVGDRGWGFFASMQTCRSRRRGQGSREARPRQRPEGLEAGAVRQTMWGGGEGSRRVSVGLRGLGAVRSSVPVCPAVGKPGLRLPVIPSPVTIM